MVDSSIKKSVITWEVAAHYSLEITVIDYLEIRELACFITMWHCPEFFHVYWSMNIYCCCVSLSIAFDFDIDFVTVRSKNFVGFGFG